MGHDTHFLERITERVDPRHAELALSLYQDPELVRAILSHAQLGDGGPSRRLAISLDDPTEGPFVLVGADGTFITCLARGMTVGDAPVLTRAKLDQLTLRHETLREQLAAGREAAAARGGVVG